MKTRQKLNPGSHNGSANHKPKTSARRPLNISATQADLALLATIAKAENLHIAKDPDAAPDRASADVGTPHPLDRATPLDEQGQQSTAGAQSEPVNSPDKSRNEWDSKTSGRADRQADETAPTGHDRETKAAENTNAMKEEIKAALSDLAWWRNRKRDGAFRRGLAWSIINRTEAAGFLSEEYKKLEARAEKDPSIYEHYGSISRNMVARLAIDVGMLFDYHNASYDELHAYLRGVVYGVENFD